MSTRRVQGSAFAAVLMVSLMSEGRPLAAGAAKDRDRGFSIFDHKGVCGHEGDDSKATLDVSDEDNLIWWIANSCKTDQEVRLCVYKKADRRLFNPFRKCSPGKRDIDTVFKVNSRREVEVNCKGAQPGAYLKLIEVGTTISGAHCPDPLPSLPTDDPRTHVLDIEIVP